MKLKVFTVFDDKAAAFLTPFFIQNVPMAIRSFDEACTDPKSAFSKHPSDYTLYELGEYDDATGAISMREPIKRIGSGSNIYSPLVERKKDHA